MRFSSFLRCLPFLCLCFVLVACGSSRSSQAACKVDYWDGAVGTCLPAGWKVVDPAMLRDRGLPDEIIAVFQAEQLVAGQIPAVVVTKEILVRDMDTVSYSDASIASVTSMPGYALLDDRDITVDKQKARLHMFTAQPIPEEPKKRFSQVSVVARRIGYTFTAATPVSVDSVLEEQIASILEHATFHAPN